MSADNGIYILITTDSHKKYSNEYVNCLPDGIVAYRVAHANAIDSLEWYEENQPYNVGYFLYRTWCDGGLFYSYEFAMKYAEQLAKRYSILEYGIVVIDRKQYCFPT